MAEHNVDIQNVQESEAYVSVTGACCGRQVAVVLPKEGVPTKTEARRRVLAKALALAHEGGRAPAPSSAAIRVEV